MPTINNYSAFELTEDKFQTSFTLKNSGVPCTSFRLCHRDDARYLKNFMHDWHKMVYKPVDCWGGVGLTKIENEDTLDVLIPFLNQAGLRFFYVEKFINYDNADFRVDIVDGVISYDLSSIPKAIIKQARFHLYPNEQRYCKDREIWRVYSIMKI